MHPEYIDRLIDADNDDEHHQRSITDKIQIRSLIEIWKYDFDDRIRSVI